MSTTYGERDAMSNLAVAWDILGGLPCTGICGYISDFCIYRRQIYEKYFKLRLVLILT